MIKQFIFTIIAVFSMIMVLADVVSSQFFFSGFALIAVAFPACWYGLKANTASIKLEPANPKHYL